MQGLVLADPAQLEPRFAPLGELLRAFVSTLEAAGMGRVEGALGSALVLEEIGTICVGVTSASEFREILAAYEAAEQSASSVDFERFTCGDERLVNPARWVELEQ